MKRLQNLVSQNGGFLFLFKELNDGGDDDGASKLYSALLNIIKSSHGRNGSFIIHTSSSIELSHIIGPAVSSQSIVHNEGDSATLCVTSSVNSHHSFSIFFKLTENLVFDHIYFQFLVRYTNFKSEAYFFLCYY